VRIHKDESVATHRLTRKWGRERKEGFKREERTRQKIQKEGGDMLIRVPLKKTGDKVLTCERSSELKQIEGKERDREGKLGEGLFGIPGPARGNLRNGVRYARRVKGRP